MPLALCYRPPQPPRQARCMPLALRSRSTPATTGRWRCRAAAPGLPPMARRGRARQARGVSPTLLFAPPIPSWGGHVADGTSRSRRQIACLPRFALALLNHQWGRAALGATAALGGGSAVCRARAPGAARCAGRRRRGAPEGAAARPVDRSESRRHAAPQQRWGRRLGAPGWVGAAPRQRPPPGNMRRRGSAARRAALARA